IHIPPPTPARQFIGGPHRPNPLAEPSVREMQGANEGARKATSRSSTQRPRPATPQIAFNDPTPLAESSVREMQGANEGARKATSRSSTQRPRPATPQIACDRLGQGLVAFALDRPQN